MGLLTLVEFREELSAIFAPKAVGNRRLDRWINLAYNDVCGENEFENLMEIRQFTTAEGFPDYDLPPRFLGYKTIQNTTSGKRLIKMDKNDISLVKQDEDNWASPTHWARRKNKLILLPVPDDGEDGNGYEIEETYMIEPSPLEKNTAKTVLPAQWDQVILLKAQAYGHTGLKEHQDAQVVDKKAGIQSYTRRRDGTLSEPTPKAGLSVAWDWSDLTDQDGEPPRG